MLHCCTMSNPGKTHYILAEQPRASVRCLTLLYVLPLNHIRIQCIFFSVVLFFSTPRWLPRWLSFFLRPYSRTLRCLTLCFIAVRITIAKALKITLATRPLRPSSSKVRNCFSYTYFSTFCSSEVLRCNTSRWLPRWLLSSVTSFHSTLG